MKKMKMKSGAIKEMIGSKLNRNFRNRIAATVLVAVMTLLTVSESMAVTYYSRNLDATPVNFSVLSNWNTNRSGGGGSSPASLALGDDFVIQSGDAITLDSSTPQILSLTIEGGGTFDNSSNTLNVGYSSGGGLVDILSTGTYTASSGSISLFQAGFGTPAYIIRSAQSEVFNNISFSQGSLSLNSSAGSINYTINGTLGIGSSAGAISLSSVSIVYGTSSVVQYLPGADYSIGPEWTSSLDAANVVVNASGNTVSSSSGNRIVRRNLTLTAGTIDVGANNLIVLGDLAGGDVAGSGIVSGSSTLALGNGLGSTNSQTITGGISLTNLDINKSGGTGGAEGINNTVTCSGQITFAASGTLDIIAGTLQFSSAGRLGGVNIGTLTLTVNSGGVLATGGQDLTGIGALSAADGKIKFNSTSGENLPTGITIGTIEVANVSGVVASLGTLTVGTLLDFTTGTLTATSSDIVLVAAGATVTGASGSSFVIGPLRRVVNDGSAYVFPLGYAGNYRPLTFDYDNFAGGDNEIIQAEYRNTNPAGDIPSGISVISPNGHYRLSRISGTAPTVITHSLTGRYTDTGFSPESRNRLLVQNGATPTYSLPASQSQNETNDDVTATGVTALPTDAGIIAFGSGGATNNWTSLSDGNWNTAGNWSAGVPISTDNVFIQQTVTVTIPSGHAAAAQSLTMDNNSHLIIQANPGINFGTGWDATRTAFTSCTVEYTAGNVHGDDYDNLIINGATTASGTINVAGDLVKSSATTLTNTGEFIVEGSYTHSAGTAAYSAGGLTVNGTPFTVSAGSVNGNITINSATLTMNGGVFGGTSYRTVSLTGPALQTVDGLANATFSHLVINNANGITFNTTSTVSGTLTLTDGIVNNVGSLMTISSSSSGSDNSYIQGPLAITNAQGRTLTYPVGASYYRPMRSTLTSAGTPTVRVQVIDTAPNGSSRDAGLIRISSIRYWLVDVSVSTVTGGTLRLYYGADDGVSDFNESGDVVVAMSTDNGASDPWTSLNGQSLGTVPDGYVASPGIGAQVIGDYYFTLGATTADNSLPVELSLFKADAAFDGVTLSWETESELQNQGFNVYRRLKSEREENWNLLTAALIPGQGSTSERTSYQYRDAAVTVGHTYEYMLESVSYDGVRVQEKIVEVNVPVPAEYALLGNYPNPFNPNTNIKFRLPESQQVSIRIYSLQGNLVRELALNQMFDAGEHSLVWDARDTQGNNVASGMYLYSFSAGKFTKTAKMLLLK